MRHHTPGVLKVAGELRTLYLHIGANKTGSSAIQRAFHRSRAAVGEAGLWYPGTSARHDVLIDVFRRNAPSLAGAVEALGRRNKAAQSDRDALASEISAHPDHDVLISNERLMVDARRLKLRQLADFLGGLVDRVVVVALVREPLAHLESWAQQRVRNGMTSYAEAVSDPEVFDFRCLDAYAQVFGDEAMVVRAMEGLPRQKGRLVPAFARLIGLPDAVADALPEETVNDRLSLEALHILGARRRREGADIPALNAEILRKVGRTRFELPAATIAAKSAALAAQRDYLASRWGITYAATERTGATTPTPVWDAETLAALADVMERLAAENRRLKQAQKPRSN